VTVPNYPIAEDELVTDETLPRHIRAADIALEPARGKIVFTDCRV
jgi:hypothetical protein